MGIDGFSPLLYLMVISPFLGFKEEWANYRKHMTVPPPDAGNFLFILPGYSYPVVKNWVQVNRRKFVFEQ